MGSKVFESRSKYFLQLFDALGLRYRVNDTGRIDNTSPLRINEHSIQLYFNEANSLWGAYFAAHEGVYADYDWTTYWLTARVDKLEQGYRKVVPYPGQEHLALAELLGYIQSTVRVRT